MATLDEFLTDKRIALKAMMDAATADPKPFVSTASVEVRGRSGVRAIRIRQFDLVSDTGPHLAGFDLGPTSPEYQLAALGGCIAHTAEMLAAEMELSIDEIAVEVTSQMHPLAQTPGYEDVPRVPHKLHYALTISSKEPGERIEALHRKIQETCPIYNLIRHPQPVSGDLILKPAS